MFRGKGLEFDGYRDFSPDDDAQDIDWKASSRSGRTIVKRYKEERDLKIMFLVDVGDNMVFGSTPKLKCEYATELTAAFSHILVNTNDKIGFILFGDEIKEYSNFKSGFNFKKLYKVAKVVRFLGLEIAIYEIFLFTKLFINVSV